MNLVEHWWLMRYRNGNVGGPVYTDGVEAGAAARVRGARAMKVVRAEDYEGAVEERDVFSRALTLACKRFRDGQAFKDDCLRRAGEELARSGGQ